MSESAMSSSSSSLPPPIPTLADLKTWTPLELIFYLRKLYLDQLDDDVFRCLRRNRITGSWFLYMCEKDYLNWRFTRTEAQILVHEARMIAEEASLPAVGEKTLAGELTRMLPLRRRSRPLANGGRIPPRREDAQACTSSSGVSFFGRERSGGFVSEIYCEARWEWQARCLTGSVTSSWARFPTHSLLPVIRNTEEEQYHSAGREDLWVVAGYGKN